MGKNKVQQKSNSVQQEQKRKQLMYRMKALRLEDGTYEMVVQCSDGRQVTVGRFMLPYDNQRIQDYATLKNIADALEKRCLAKENQSDMPSRVGCSYHDILFEQVGVSAYQFYLPDGILIGAVMTPCDMRYSCDITLIKSVCRQLAYRYGIE